MPSKLAAASTTRGVMLPAPIRSISDMVAKTSSGRSTLASDTGVSGATWSSGPSCVHKERRWVSFVRASHCGSFEMQTLLLSSWLLDVQATGFHFDRKWRKRAPHFGERGAADGRAGTRRSGAEGGRRGRAGRAHRRRRRLYARVGRTERAFDGAHGSVRLRELASRRTAHLFGRTPAAAAGAGPRPRWCRHEDGVAGHGARRPPRTLGWTLVERRVATIQRAKATWGKPREQSVNRR